MNVSGVKPHPKNEAWRIVTLDEKDFICFSARDADALKVGAALPEGAEFADPKFEGALPSVRLPRSKSAPQAAWRNTKDGAHFEARAKAINTAVMQSATIDEADAWLSWQLRQLGMSGSVTYGEGVAGSGTSSAEHGSTGDASSADQTGGSRANSGEGSGSCSHPTDKRRETPSGRIRCMACGELVD